MDSILFRKLSTISIIGAAKLVSDKDSIKAVMAQKPCVIKEGKWHVDTTGANQLIINVPTNVTSPALFIVPASAKLTKDDGTVGKSKDTYIGYAKVGSYAEEDFLRKDNGKWRLVTVRLVLTADKFDRGYLVAMKFRSQSYSNPKNAPVTAPEVAQGAPVQAVQMPIIPKT